MPFQVIMGRMAAQTGRAPKFKIVACHGLKGGVGKSSITAAIATRLSREGVKVGLLDADVDSPFLAEILGLRDKVGLDDHRIMQPVLAHGMRVMSFAAYVQNAFSGATMPGSMHQQWLSDAIQNTDWDDTELLVADLSAGASDEFLTVTKIAKNNFLGLVVVGLSNLTTSLDRVWNGASFHHIPILGVIENMSGPVFGEGGVKAWCEAKKAPFFGSIPMDARIGLGHTRHESLLPDDLMPPIGNAANQILKLLGKKVVVEWRERSN